MPNSATFLQKDAPSCQILQSSSHVLPYLGLCFALFSENLAVVYLPYKIIKQIQNRNGHIPFFLKGVRLGLFFLFSYVSYSYVFLSPMFPAIS